MHPLLAQAYETELRPVCAFLWRLGAHSDEVEDLAHDLFLTAMKRWDSFDQGRPLRPWLMGIAFRVFSESRKRQRRAYAPDETTDHGGIPQIEHRRAIERVLSKVSNEQRAVFVMHELEGMSAPEISEVMEVPVGTTYSRLRLARLEITAEVQRQRLQEARHVS